MQRSPDEPDTQSPAYVSSLQPGTYHPWARHGGDYMYNFYFPQAPSSTPWAPAWRPDGKAIAVGMSGFMWSIDPATGVATELTRGAKYHSSPTWSPDGRWIIYTAADGGNTIQLEILLDVQSRETRPLAGVARLAITGRDRPRTGSVPGGSDGLRTVEGGGRGDVVPPAYAHSMRRIYMAKKRSFDVSTGSRPSGGV